MCIHVGWGRDLTVNHFKFTQYQKHTATVAKYGCYSWRSVGARKDYILEALREYHTI